VRFSADEGCKSTRAVAIVEQHHAQIVRAVRIAALGSAGECRQCSRAISILKQQRTEVETAIWTSPMVGAFERGQCTRAIVVLKEEVAELVRPGRVSARVRKSKRLVCLWTISVG
jgi:hypothetical protein